MAYETDERLKGYLDTNQMGREQMCRSVLALDRRFSQVTPRHPRGGPDGGRDIQAIFRGELLTYVAVGFVNQANDSDEQKKKIRKKFSDDADSASESDEEPLVFVFLTNLNLTVGEKDDLNAYAKTKGFVVSEIMDRERIRIALDSADGFSIRFQHLAIPLSEAEQASFFAKWGDDIDSLISEGFRDINGKLDRIIFLQESSDILTSFTLSFELKKEFSAYEIGHFRAFCMMHLKGPIHDVIDIFWGSSDRSNRFREGKNSSLEEELPGIKNGISSGQWESYLRLNVPESETEKEAEDGKDGKYELVGSGSSIGRNKLKFLGISYGHDDFMRVFPRPRIKDFDGAMYLPVMNRSLAEKVAAIHVYANGYKIEEYNSEDFKIDASNFEPPIPAEFLSDELDDEWVRLRPSSLSSAFHVSFSNRTPRRLFESPLADDSLEAFRKKSKN
jgi:hypothetical protein